MKVYVLINLYVGIAWKTGRDRDAESFWTQMDAYKGSIFDLSAKSVLLLQTGYIAWQCRNQAGMSTKSNFD